MTLGGSSGGRGWGRTGGGEMGDRLIQNTSYESMELSTNERINYW